MLGSIVSVSLEAQYISHDFILKFTSCSKIAAGVPCCRPKVAKMKGQRLFLSRISSCKQPSQMFHQHFYLHCIGQNLVTWPYVAIRKTKNIFSAEHCVTLNKMQLFIIKEEDRRTDVRWLQSVSSTVLILKPISGWVGAGGGQDY